MKLQDFFNKNYDITTKRGLINSKTRDVDFRHKVEEELQEVIDEMIRPNRRKEKVIEIGDLMCVCANWINHNTDNPVEVIKYVLSKNEKRIPHAKR